MNTLTNLLKDHQVGTWCKRAAWIILAIGLIEIALNIYNVSRQFGYGSPPLPPVLLVQIVGFGIAVLPSVLFYFFILYAAGALVNHFVADTEIESHVDEEEETVSGQMR
jgi:polyferredoxin